MDGFIFKKNQPKKRMKCLDNQTDVLDAYQPQPRSSVSSYS